MQQEVKDTVILIGNLRTGNVLGKSKGNRFPAHQLFNLILYLPGTFGCQFSQNIIAAGISPMCPRLCRIPCLCFFNELDNGSGIIDHGFSKLVSFVPVPDIFKAFGQSVMLQKVLNLIHGKTKDIAFLKRQNGIGSRMNALPVDRKTAGHQRKLEIL